MCFLAVIFYMDSEIENIKNGFYDIYSKKYEENVENVDFNPQNDVFMPILEISGKNDMKNLKFSPKFEKCTKNHT